MTTKAKRKLSDLSFKTDGAHVALVSKQQGGAANKQNYSLLLKSVNFSEEYIQKMQQVKVTMELPEFLRKFFNVYYEDAEVLARMMGYVAPESNTDVTYDYEDYISSRLEAFEILKSVHDAESISDVLSGLDETQYLSMLNDQALIEKALKKLDKQNTESVKKELIQTESELVAKATETDNSTHASVETKVEVSTSEVTKSKEPEMTKPVKTELQEVSVEMVEKSAFVDIQKALEEQKEQLQKALDTIAVFQKEKQEAIVKSKTSQFQAVIKDAKLQEPIIKAALSLESDDDFGAFLAAITAMASAVETSQEFMEKSALFQEQGASVSSDTPVQESAVARILKAKQIK